VLPVCRRVRSHDPGQVNGESLLCQTYCPCSSVFFNNPKQAGASILSVVMTLESCCGMRIAKKALDMLRAPLYTVPKRGIRAQKASRSVNLTRRSLRIPVCREWQYTRKSRRYCRCLQVSSAPIFKLQPQHPTCENMPSFKRPVAATTRHSPSARQQQGHPSATQQQQSRDALSRRPT
jgi:hypothetical protein